MRNQAVKRILFPRRAAAIERAHEVAIDWVRIWRRLLRGQQYGTFGARLQFAAVNCAE
jgi:hypothetical protein